MIHERARRTDRRREHAPSIPRRISLSFGIHTRIRRDPPHASTLAILRGIDTGSVYRWLFALRIWPPGIHHLPKKGVQARGVIDPDRLLKRLICLYCSETGKKWRKEVKDRCPSGSGSPAVIKTQGTILSFEQSTQTAKEEKMSGSVASV